MKKRIVLIEDNSDMRENIAEILELDGYEVAVAENGKQGVELILKNPPDLIICDIMMPELDGYGVLHVLNKNSKTAHIPFIFLTAKADKTDFRKGMNLGADDYISKPFEDIELLDAIQIRLEKREQIEKPFSRDMEGLTAFIDEARGYEELKKLSSQRESKLYRKKEFIFNEGKYPKQVYLILSGKVKTFRINEDGKEYITGLYKTGDFVGYTPLLQDTSYAASAQVMEDAEVCSIPKDDFYRLIHSNKDVSYKFIRLLAGDLEQAESRLINLAYDSVRKRVADGLLMLEKRYKEESGNDNFKIAILRDDLASIVGTAKETVIRTLSDFKQENLITINGGEITLLNHDGLEHIIG